MTLPANIIPRRSLKLPFASNRSEGKVVADLHSSTIYPLLQNATKLAPQSSRSIRTQEAISVVHRT